MREEFIKGQKVRLDGEFSNGSIVEVVDQSKGRLYTTVKSDGKQWTVMTVRLDKILNEGIRP